MNQSATRYRVNQLRGIEQNGSKESRGGIEYRSIRYGNKTRTIDELMYTYPGHRMHYEFIRMQVYAPREHTMYAHLHTSIHECI